MITPIDPILEALLDKSRLRYWDGRDRVIGQRPSGAVPVPNFNPMYPPQSPNLRLGPGNTMARFPVNSDTPPGMFSPDQWNRQIPPATPQVPPAPGAFQRLLQMWQEGAKSPQPQAYDPRYYPRTR